MADPKPECPTPEQVEARLNDLAQIYDLGIALREIRLVEAEATSPSSRLAGRVSDVGPSASPKPVDAPRPDSSATDARPRPDSDARPSS